MSDEHYNLCSSCWLTVITGAMLNNSPNQKAIWDYIVHVPEKECENKRCKYRQAVETGELI